MARIKICLSERDFMRVRSFLIVTLFSSLTYSTACTSESTQMPTEETIAALNKEEIPASYQLLYHSSELKTPDPNQQRLRVLIWLDRMNCNNSQLELLEQLRRKVLEKENRLREQETEREKQIIQEQTPIYNEIWDAMREGKDLDSEEVSQLMQELNQIRLKQEGKQLLNPRLEAIKSILDLEQIFLQSLSPEQEATIIDALYFMRHILDPVGNPRDFSLLVGNTYEPGQYAILLKGTSALAKQSGNIGGLWTDEPELTGRILHEARREVILYLALLEPELEGAIRAAKERQSLKLQSPTP